MIVIKNVIGSIAVSLVLLAGVFSAGAIPLSPGQSTNAVGELDPVGATLLFQTNKFFTSDSFSGTLISSVYSGDLSNNLGGLTFTYQFNIDLGSADAAKSLTVGSTSGGFGGYLTDVSFQIPNIFDIAPDSVSRSPAATGGGRNITFDFAGNGYVLPGDTTAVLVIQTSANGFILGNASLQDDVALPNIVTLIPTTIPEPTSFALFSFGFIGLVGITYQKRQNRLKTKKQVCLPHPADEL